MKIIAYRSIYNVANTSEFAVCVIWPTDLKGMKVFAYIFTS